jgi:aromatic ring-cleaving dioxygenase
MADMAPVIVPGRDVRLPRKARDAVARHRPVEVRHHDKPAYYVLHADDFAVIEHILERHRGGLSVPVTDLLTDDDFAVFADEREMDAGLDVGVLAAWEG